MGEKNSRKDARGHTRKGEIPNSNLQTPRIKFRKEWLQYSSKARNSKHKT